jgi:hypothetical protein
MAPSPARSVPGPEGGRFVQSGRVSLAAARGHLAPPRRSPPFRALVDRGQDPHPTPSVNPSDDWPRRLVEKRRRESPDRVGSPRRRRERGPRRDHLLDARSRWSRLTPTGHATVTPIFSSFRPSLRDSAGGTLDPNANLEALGAVVTHVAAITGGVRPPLQPLLDAYWNDGLFRFAGLAITLVLPAWLT